MTKIVIEGDPTAGWVTRKKTGLWSFDWATRGGPPIGCVWEIYGFSSVGKTSFAQFIGGRIEPDGEILMAEIEHRLSRDYLIRNLELAGFEGKVHLLPKGKWKKGITHEDILQELYKMLLDESSVSVAILDSVGALLTTAQVKGTIGQAFVGKEAKLVWQLLRKTVYALKRGRPPDAPPVTMLLVNHSHGVIGGRGVTTSGGEGPSYLSAVRVMFTVDERFKQDGSMVLKGWVKKLTFGPEGRQFRVVLLADVGIHPGLTAMQDCIDLKIGTRSKSGMVSIGKTKVARIGTMLKYAREGKDAKFEPFIEALSKYDGPGPD
jgi:RecA/RadA recombinase